MNNLNKIAFASIFLIVAVAISFAFPAVTNAQYYNTNNNCTYHAYQRCSGSNLYWYDSCGNPQDYTICSGGCYNNVCQTNYNYNYNYNYNGNCSYHAFQRCSGNSLYWYDSCGNQEDISQYCINGCYNNTCFSSTNNYNYNYNPNYNYNYTGSNGSCTFHAYKGCSGNNVFWYDSCGNQQDLISNCGTASCQYGQCGTGYYGTTQTPSVGGYVFQYKTGCYQNSVYWFDSNGSVGNRIKSCTDKNSCTADTCSASKCKYTVKCDGSTCAAGSADYNNYCATATPTTPNTTPTVTPATPATPTTGNTASQNGLSSALFVKQDSATSQWEKSAHVGQNSRIYFLVAATNSSKTQIDNVTVSANIPSEVSSLGNLQVNGVSLTGDIVTGINIGSVAPLTTKLVTFEGRTQTFSNPSTKQATATSDVSGSKQTDTVSINFNPTQTSPTAAISTTVEATGFGAFLKRWYLWILGALVLIFLFVIIFRRLSSES